MVGRQIRRGHPYHATRCPEGQLQIMIRISAKDMYHYCSLRNPSMFHVAFAAARSTRWAEMKAHRLKKPFSRFTECIERSLIITVLNVKECRHQPNENRQQVNSHRTRRCCPRRRKKYQIALKILVLSVAHWLAVGSPSYCLRTCYAVFNYRRPFPANNS